MKNPRWLERAVSRSAEHLWMLGSVLDEYCRIEVITRDELASFLGCNADVLAWLSLCRKPAADRFAEDIVKIAERFELDASKLAQVVRRVEIVTVLRHKPHTQVKESMLLAARDRKNQKESK